MKLIRGIYLTTAEANLHFTRCNKRKLHNRILRKQFNTTKLSLIVAIKFSLHFSMAKLVSADAIPKQIRAYDPENRLSHAPPQISVCRHERGRETDLFLIGPPSVRCNGRINNPAALPLPCVCSRRSPQGEPWRLRI